LGQQPSTRREGAKVQGASCNKALPCFVLSLVPLNLVFALSISCLGGSLICTVGALVHIKHYAFNRAPVKHRSNGQLQLHFSASTVPGAFKPYRGRQSVLHDCHCYVRAPHALGAVPDQPVERGLQHLHLLRGGCLCERLGARLDAQGQQQVRLGDGAVDLDLELWLCW